MTLLVSKIDDIRVIQVGDSVLSSENKKQESSKVGFEKIKASKKNQGQNTTVDLGKGAEKYSLKFFVFDRKENEALFEIVRHKRYCTITDKFKGKVKVYIDNYKIIDSDKHINRTIYDIQCTAQDVEKAPTFDFTSKLKNLSEELEKDIEASIKKIVESGDISTLDTIFDAVEQAEKFVDSVLDTIQNGMMKILDFQSKVLNAFNEVRRRIDKAKRLVETLKQIISMPKMFIDLVKETAEDLANYNIDLFEAYRDGKKLTEIAEGDVSSIEWEAIKKVVKATKLNNMIALYMETKQLLKGNFETEDEFNSFVEKSLKRLETLQKGGDFTQLEIKKSDDSDIGYTYEEIIEKQHIIKNFANQQKYRKIISYEIQRETPLAQVVYSIYGNLDLYDTIKQINNFKDCDRVVGTIKVIDENLD